MNTRISTMLAAGALTALVFAPVPALGAQAPERQRPPEESQSQRAMSIQGELVSVDTDDRVIVVRSAEGNEVELQYNERTEVAGSKEGVAGLATMRNQTVTVQFVEDPQTRERMATRIVVQPRQ